MRDLLAVVIGFVLLVAGAQKLLAGPDALVRIVRGYRLVGPKLATVIGRTLPFVEIGVGMGLIALVQVSALAWAAAAMFASFAVAISVNLVRGRSEIPCGCFGQSDETIGAGALLRALFLFAAAVAVHLVDVPIDLDVSRAAYVGLLWVTAATIVLFCAAVGAIARMQRLGRDLLPIVKAMDRESSWLESGGDA